MKTVFQRGEYDCGIACVAMLKGITLEQAKRACDEHYEKGSGISPEEMGKALSKLDIKLGERQEIENLGKIKNNSLILGPIFPVVDLPKYLDEVHLGVKFSLENLDISLADGTMTMVLKDHWAVWDAKERVLRDPYRYKMPFMPCYYYEVGSVA